MNRGSLSLLGLFALGASPAGAQVVVNVGPRVGAHVGYIPHEQWLAGPQLFWPVSSTLDLYPSFDYWFSRSQSAWVLNMDLKAAAPSRDVSWYLGGGLAYYHSSADGNSFGGAGVNLVSGLEGRSGRVLPYLEARWAMGKGGGAFRVGGGLNWH